MRRSRAKGLGTGVIGDTFGDTGSFLGGHADTHDSSHETMKA